MNTRNKLLTPEGVEVPFFMDNLRKRFKFLGKIWLKNPFENKKNNINTRKSILLRVKITIICTYSIILIQIMTKLESPYHFSGGILRKVLGVGIFYFNLLLFSTKQSYIADYAYIRVGVVRSPWWSSREMSIYNLRSSFFFH